jgi:CubicO group peptidase (beta-lactamase class C family)
MTGPVAAGAHEFEAKLAAFVKEHRLYGAMAGVVHGDEVAWSGGVGYADAAARRRPCADTLYRIASITKTFTGTAIMQLRDAGQLDLDDPAVKWIPELARSASPATIGTVTIRRLLSHESGLVSWPPGTDFSAPKAMIYEGMMARNLDRVSEIYTALPPNTQHKYSNLGYQLLGEIVHRVSGVEFAQYVRDRILSPLRMTSTEFGPFAGDLASRQAVGYAERSYSDELAIATDTSPMWAEGGLWSTVADLCRWLSFQLSPYTEGGSTADVLSAATLKEMHEPRYLKDEDWTTAWGISWYACRKDDVSWIQHVGGLPGFFSNVCFDRKSRVGAVVLINGSADASVVAMKLAEVARGLVTASAPEVRLPAAAPAEVRALLGLYATADMSWVVRLEWRDGKLTAIDAQNVDDWVPYEPANGGGFTAAAGFRQSGEPLGVTHHVDGTVVSITFGGDKLYRLDLVDAAR